MPDHDPSVDTELLEAFLQDDDLERLEHIAEEFNIFEVLDAVRQELRHSSFLAWLLDPSGSHGLGDYFLKRFLWRTAALAREQDIKTISPIRVGTLDLGDVVVRREWRNIDILILSESQRFVCAVENKVDSPEQPGQLRRYRETCETESPRYSRHFVFLTPTGTQASDKEWVALGYHSVLDLVKAVINAKQGSLGNEVRLFLQQYVSMLRRHIVGESDIKQVCVRIYNKHRRALDLLFEHRPDRQSDIQALLERLIESDSDFELDHSTKANIKFAPLSWTSPHLKTATAWPTKSGGILLFSHKANILLFELWNGPGSGAPSSLRLALILGPGDQDVRSRISEAAARSQSDGIFNAPKGVWRECYSIFELDLLSSQEYQQDDLELMEGKIRQRFNVFKATQFPQIDEVIRAIVF